MNNPAQSAINDWLSTPLGQRCLTNERRLVGHALEHVFGEQLVQIGCWGGADSFLARGRTQHRALLGLHGNADAEVIGDPAALPIVADSVDAVILPHTLERSAKPHALLREVDRILRPDGQLIVLTFMPSGPWGIRHLFSPGGYPVGQQRMIRERRLRDWLELLSFDIGATRHYCHTLPFESFQRLGTFPGEAWANRWLPILCGGYLLHAQKRVQRLTPIRPAWRKPRLRAVRGLKPSTHVSANACAADQWSSRRESA